jgi:hypothetical protein
VSLYFGWRDSRHGLVKQFKMVTRINIWICMYISVAEFSGIASIAPPYHWNGRMTSLLYYATCEIPPPPARKLWLRLVYSLYSATAKKLCLGNISRQTSPFETCVRQTHTAREKAISFRSSVHLNSLCAPRHTASITYRRLVACATSEWE